MKNFWNAVIIGLFLFLCVGSLYAFSRSGAIGRFTQPQAQADTSRKPLVEFLQTATSTPVPTATIDYQATSAVQQSQLDAANAQILNEQGRAINALNTAVYLSNIGIQVTLSEQEIILNSQYMTGTAGYLTQNAPATPTPNATATHEKNMVDVGALTAISVQMTSAAEAPQRIVEMSNARARERFAWLDIFGKYITAAAAILLVGGILFVVVLRGSTSRSDPVQPAPKEDVTWFPEAKQVFTDVKVAAPDGSQNWLYSVPCEQEAFFEFCNGIINEKISLAYNNWEGAGSPLTRKNKNSFRDIRNFLMANRFAKSSDSTKTLVLTAAGEEFMRAYLDDGKLPHSFSFTPNSSGLSGETAHMSEPHTHEQAVGEGDLVPLTPDSVK